MSNKKYSKNDINKRCQTYEDSNKNKIESASSFEKYNGSKVFQKPLSLDKKNPFEKDVKKEDLKKHLKIMKDHLNLCKKFKEAYDNKKISYIGENSIKKMKDVANITMQLEKNIKIVNKILGKSKQRKNKQIDEQEKSINEDSGRNDPGNLSRLSNVKGLEKINWGSRESAPGTSEEKHESIIENESTPEILENLLSNIKGMRNKLNKGHLPPFSKEEKHESSIIENESYPGMLESLLSNIKRMRNELNKVDLPPLSKEEKELKHTTESKGGLKLDNLPSLSNVRNETKEDQGDWIYNPKDNVYDNRNHKHSMLNSQQDLYKKYTAYGGDRKSPAYPNVAKFIDSIAREAELEFKKSFEEEKRIEKKKRFENVMKRYRDRLKSNTNPAAELEYDVKKADDFNNKIDDLRNLFYKVERNLAKDSKNVDNFDNITDVNMRPNKGVANDVVQDNAVNIEDAEDQINEQENPTKEHTVGVNPSNLPRLSNVRSVDEGDLAEWKKRINEGKSKIEMKGKGDNKIGDNLNQISDVTMPPTKRGESVEGLEIPENIADSEDLYMQDEKETSSVEGEDDIKIGDNPIDLHEQGEGPDLPPENLLQKLVAEDVDTKRERHEDEEDYKDSKDLYEQEENPDIKPDNFIKKDIQVKREIEVPNDKIFKNRSQIYNNYLNKALLRYRNNDDDLYALKKSIRVIDGISKKWKKSKKYGVLSRFDKKHQARKEKFYEDEWNKNIKDGFELRENKKLNKTLHEYFNDIWNEYKKKGVKNAKEKAFHKAHDFNDAYNEQKRGVRKLRKPEFFDQNYKAHFYSDKKSQKSEVFPYKVFIKRSKIYNEAYIKNFKKLIKEYKDKPVGYVEKKAKDKVDELSVNWKNRKRNKSENKNKEIEKRLHFDLSQLVDELDDELPRQIENKKDEKNEEHDGEDELYVQKPTTRANTPGERKIKTLVSRGGKKENNNKNVEIEIIRFPEGVRNNNTNNNDQKENNDKKRNENTKGNRNPNVKKVTKDNLENKNNNDILQEKQENINQNGPYNGEVEDFDGNEPGQEDKKGNNNKNVKIDINPLPEGVRNNDVTANDQKENNDKKRDENTKGNRNPNIEEVTVDNHENKNNNELLQENINQNGPGYEDVEDFHQNQPDQEDLGFYENNETDNGKRNDQKRNNPQGKIDDEELNQIDFKKLKPYVLLNYKKLVKKYELKKRSEVYIYYYFKFLDRYKNSEYGKIRNNAAKDAKDAKDSVDKISARWKKSKDRQNKNEKNKMAFYRDQFEKFDFVLRMPKDEIIEIRIEPPEEKETPEEKEKEIPEEKENVDKMTNEMGTFF